MKYPKIKSAQSLIDLLQQKEVKDIIISPGSRNAPLTIGFTENSFFNSYSIVDERSAAFFAMGISQQSNKPSVVVSTSGSALLNYAPAVAEAYYSKIPLIVVSADRPKEWIDQADGQTIRQENALANHILESVTLKEGEDKTSIWFNERLINEAVNISIEKRGPVHINIPFSEPLYETVSEKGVNPKNIKLPKARPQLEVEELERYAEIWNSSSRKMVLVGNHTPNEQVSIQLNHIAKDPSVLVLTETTSNMHGDNFISNIDQLINNLSKDEEEDLKPQILITLGGLIVSKKIKAFLRNCNMYHWHIGDDLKTPDTYQNLSSVFRVDPDMFFSQFFFLKQNKKSDYRDKFLAIRNLRKESHKDFISKTEFSDLKIYDTLIKKLPQDIQLHSSNSSVIRYFQLFDKPGSWDMFCNRGTSGVDGATSTAIGASLYAEKPVVLVTGDISFFYDSNALWNNYIPKNFKIILINNGGGSIFKIIPGPSSSSALEKFFQTKHNLKAKGLAETYGLKYLRADNQENFESALNKLISEKGACILEVNTSKVENEKVLSDYWEYIK
ncbi:MAG: 2-succinyl-5-enolpyruvyl-6-hydroxy-3-cyclohexene-1-carboxylic-acid synthase [Bacteroidota bacterium]